MMRQDAPQPGPHAPGRLRLASVVRQETTRETGRLRHHRGDSQTTLPKARVCPETPTPHSTSPGDAPRHHNLPTAPYDYPQDQCKETSLQLNRAEAHLRRCEPSHPQIIKELRCWINPSHEQMITRTGAGD